MSNMLGLHRKSLMCHPHSIRSRNRMVFPPGQIKQESECSTQHPIKALKKNQNVFQVSECILMGNLKLYFYHELYIMLDSRVSFIICREVFERIFITLFNITPSVLRRIFILIYRIHDISSFTDAIITRKLISSFVFHCLFYAQDRISSIYVIS